MEMHKRRKSLTEAEVRYLVKQICLACLFLHEKRIVHRDLKLGNLFINEQMELKVGDFGLATRISDGNERKLTLCGTPNYIAPEILLKKGHGFEADVWSLGCIVYTLVVGKPPFESSDLKETYRRIRHNEFVIPASVPNEVRQFITKMLQTEPSKRPSMKQIMDDPYLVNNYIPSRLPTSCLTTAPRFGQERLSMLPTESIASPRRPLSDRNYDVQIGGEVAGKKHNVLSTVPEKAEQIEITPQNICLKELCKNITKMLKVCRQTDRLIQETEDPASTPIFWISKWVDYTDKYGLGYQLCDNSIGVLFNDYSRIVLMADENNLQYIERTGIEDFHTLANYPTLLNKKITLLKYFRNYMNEHLLKMGEKTVDGDDIARLPYLKHWFRTRNAIVFLLTNGTVQVRSHFSVKAKRVPNFLSTLFLDQLFR